MNATVGSSGALKMEVQVGGTSGCSSALMRQFRKCNIPLLVIRIIALG
jgi:hypothetical protein